MPVAPKSPRPKKQNGLAKPKGAVRAKSGCYTCRIRRKKCDEKRIPNESGIVACETCNRLRLECLGFGAKRPDWLRETARVDRVREKIKAHLASQGMIKGHAGSGSKTIATDDILRLSDWRDEDGNPRQINYQSGTSDSGSQRGREDSAESDMHPVHPMHHPHPHSHSYIPSYAQQSHSHEPPDSWMSHDASMEGYELNGVSANQYSPPHSPHSQNYDVSMNDISYTEPYANTYTENNQLLPATRSSFSKHNHDQWVIDDEGPTTLRPGDLFMPISPSVPISVRFIEKSVKHYVDNVVKIQYLLGDSHILPNMIWEAIQHHQASHEAVLLLSHTYQVRQREPGLQVICDKDVAYKIQDLERLLNQRHTLTADDAMTALHLVSLYLFDGGTGAWHQFLNFSCKYVMRVLDDPKYRGDYVSALNNANDKDQFVVKTTLWFDVLASLTTRRPPVLLQYVRELFKPEASFVGMPPQYDMMSPMGCRNQTVWALAEASDLAFWKRNQERQGKLSYRELLRRVHALDDHLNAPPSPVPPQGDSEQWSRYLTSEIFRTATRLFLRCIESGDYPDVDDIQTAVDDTFEAIMVKPPLNNMEVSAIVRSTVFGIYICGALTRNSAQRERLRLHLQQNSGHEGVGNCVTILNLLEKLWAQADLEPHMPVPWRRMLRMNRTLLV
ncbi:fungal-specific transcription factor domain-containing protein [Panaeolus papilionaceus]|nr:fungal-specific transcription factor domain-containing protein [Panaeolus papilionaceus]